MTLQDRITYIRAVLGQPRYFGVAAIGTAAHLLITVASVQYIHENLGGFFISMRASYTIPYTAMAVISAFFLGITLALVVERIDELRLHTASLGIGGLLAGSLAIGCPGCFFGLFPLLLSLFGITATLAILPFNGLELQALSILLLGTGIWFLAKPAITCKLTASKK
jgi:hypothetical protein